MPCRLCTSKSLACKYRTKTERIKSKHRHELRQANVVKIAPKPVSLSPESELESTSALELTGRNVAPRNTDVVFRDASGSQNLSSRSTLTGRGEPETSFPNQNVSAVGSVSDHVGDPNTPERVHHGFSEISRRTSGKEFYGPAATLAFLLELGRRAQVYQQELWKKQQQLGDGLSAFQIANPSIVNFLHGDDNFPSATTLADDDDNDNTEPLSTTSTALRNRPDQFPANHDIEKECIDLFFSNLHLIYHFLNRPSFESRCQEEIWSPATSTHSQLRKTGSRFPALYNAVVAVGALTAGDDSEDKIQAFLDQYHGPRSRNPIHAPLKLASIYFEKAKRLLGDMFESCSLESQQTQLLMSIFCQYALKPHGAYMYSGMSTRTALAIGSANEPDLRKNPLENVQTWWWSYYHEIEVCCSLGRDTSLREPTYYPVYVAKLGDPMPQGFGHDDDHNLFFARCSTELAAILRQTSEQIYHCTTKSIQDKVQDALELDEKLLAWKGQLAPIFDLDSTSLTEKEQVTKRKVTLKLRFFSARILIHRAFLLNTTFSQTPPSFSSNVSLCLSAARDTIHLLYDTFINRPSLRTWWYNTTYAFNAIIIILYVLFSRRQVARTEDLYRDVEKTLSIFRAMDGVSVARRCAALTEEIFEIAKLSLRHRDSGLISRSDEVGRQAATQAEKGIGCGPRALDMQARTSERGQDSTVTAEWQETGQLDESFFAHILDNDFLDNFDSNLSVMTFDGVPFGSVGMDWGPRLD